MGNGNTKNTNASSSVNETSSPATENLSDPKTENGAVVVNHMTEMNEAPIEGEENPNTENQNEGNKPNQKQIKEKMMIRMISNCLRRLPVRPSLCSNQEILMKLYNGSKPMEIKTGKDIIIKNKQAKGIFIIRKGQAEVVTENGDVSIVKLGAGDFFGEVSTLYEVPSTARVRAISDCQLLLLKKDYVNKATKQEIPVEILDWFVNQRYMPTGGGFDAKKMERRLTLAVMSSVSVFDKWDKMSLRALILSMEADLFFLYPENSLILDKGDPPNVMFIVVRGRVGVIHNDEIVAEIDTSAGPAAFNEEGMRFARESCYRLMALTSCQIIPIYLHKIIDTMEMEEKEKAAQPWQVRQDLWSERLTILRSSIYKHNPVSLQLEVLARELEKTDIFKENFFPSLYDIVLVSKIAKYKQSSAVVFSLDPHTAVLLLVLQGTIEVNSESGKKSKLQPSSDGQALYDPLSRTERETLTTETECLIMKIQRSQALGLVGKDVNNSSWSAGKRCTTNQKSKTRLQCGH